MVEKRTSNRIDALNLSYILLNEAGDVVHQGMGRTLNMSATGILLETSFAIELGNSAVISIGLAEDILEIKGKIVHTRQLENNMFATGIEFIDVTDTEKSMLANFFKTHFV